MAVDQSLYKGLLAGLAFVFTSSSGNAVATVLRVDQDWLQLEGSAEILMDLTHRGVIEFHRERFEITLKVSPAEFMEAAGILQQAPSFDEESSACNKTDTICVRN